MKLRMLKFCPNLVEDKAFKLLDLRKWHRYMIQKNPFSIYIWVWKSFKVSLKNSWNSHVSSCYHLFISCVLFQVRKSLLFTLCCLVCTLFEFQLLWRARSTLEFIFWLWPPLHFNYAHLQTLMNNVVEFIHHLFRKQD